jgi:polar amino acid transport system substrate-binding protein
MKTKVLWIFGVLLLVLLTACGSSTPTAAPTAAPTNTSVPTEAPPAAPTSTEAAPTTSADSTWDRVEAAGKLVFGTSADYQPFEYYDENYQITGFDAALAREIGSKLGLQVELSDIAFEALPAALQIGQIDAAIAAISVSPERQQIMDFTNVYFTSDDMVLARDNEGTVTITKVEDLVPFRVGVQRGSIYATWLQETLVESGVMSEEKLLQYAKPEDAVRDLRENRNDLVVMDKLAAEEFILDGGLIAAGENLNAQLFAIALPKGAPTLQTQLNAALTELYNDGTVARLTNEFLEIDLRDATPVPMPTAIPGPTATPAGCYDFMTFVDDVTVPDGTVMQPGQDFDKVWRVRNTGTCEWGTGYQLVFVQGSQMNGSPSPVTTTVRPGETLDILIDQTAPNDPGNYAGVWQMINKDRTPFGERIWVKITVPGQAKPTTPAATATPVPDPIIDYLTVSAEAVNQGDVLVVSWSFSGVDLASATLTRSNPDGSETPLMGGADVAPQGQYEDLMMTAGIHTYTLNVSTESAGSETATVQVTVNP